MNDAKTNRRYAARTAASMSVRPYGSLSATLTKTPLVEAAKPYSAGTSSCPWRLGSATEPYRSSVSTSLTRPSTTRLAPAGSASMSVRLPHTMTRLASSRRAGLAPNARISKPRFFLASGRARARIAGLRGLRRNLEISAQIGGSCSAATCGASAGASGDSRGMREKSTPGGMIATARERARELEQEAEQELYCSRSRSWSQHKHNALAGYARLAMAEAPEKRPAGGGASAPDEKASRLAADLASTASYPQ